MIFINQDEKALVDGRNGKVFRPACFDTLVQYISYIEGRGHKANVQGILRGVMEGNKFITKMIENAQKHGCMP